MRTRSIKLSQVCSVNDGTHYTPPDSGGPFAFLTVKDMSEERLVFSGCSYISLVEFEKARKVGACPEEGAVLFSKDGTVGKVHVVGKARPFAVLSSIAILRPDPAKVDSDFLGFALQSPDVLRDAENRKTGTALRRIILEDLKEVRIPLPSLPEQQRIAELLEQADRLRRTRRYALELSDTFPPAVFLEMFGDPIVNPKGWPQARLEELGKGENAIVDGPFGSSINVEKDYVSDGDIPVIRTLNVRAFEFLTQDLKFISREKFKLVQRSRVLPGDIILTKVGTIGNVCIFPTIFREAVLSTTGSCKITPDADKVNTFYLAHFLAMLRPHMLKIASEGVQAFLNMKTIKDFMISIPPMNLQLRFAALVKRHERLRAGQREALRQAEHLFQTLLHQAFAAA
jgi:type I restriction enzyme S subunit